VEAFRRAWPQPQEEAVLVVKTQSAAADPAWLRELRAAADRPDIRLIDAALPREALLSLMASCDALVSLHRSEGFGLPVAEALALHRAVLVTGWSGTEVIAADLPEAARAPYRLVPVDDPGGPYHDLSQTWAEPDLDAAAQRLRALASDPALRRAVAAAGGAALARLDAAWTPEVLYAEPWAAGVAAAG
jgi:glycosyltransferase involved in cell wall biosynthesis